MTISVIIPAYNEEKYIADTIIYIKQAIEYLNKNSNQSVELLVIDNGSTDQTVNIAQNLGARVISEPIHIISKVRNTGANAANGNLLIFIDADTIIPEPLLWYINQKISDPKCIAGAVDIDYRPKRLLIKIYLQFWRLIGNITGMAQGATQFCQRDVYKIVGGYDERLYMGEDVDFYWRLKQFSKKEDLEVCLIKEHRVIPSCRRFDQWPLWKTLVWTNPIFISLLRRWKGVWNGWYKIPPR